MGSQVLDKNLCRPPGEKQLRKLGEEEDEEEAPPTERRREYTDLGERKEQVALAMTDEACREAVI